MVTGCLIGSALESETELTVRFDDFARLLEAGYIASLTDKAEETAHFSVIKTRREKEAALALVEPFLAEWRRFRPDAAPTMLLVSLNGLAIGASPAAGADLQEALCRKILRDMSRAAQETGLDSHGLVLPQARAWSNVKRPSIRGGLAIPKCYSLAGIFGFTYSAHPFRTAGAFGPAG